MCTSDDSLLSLVRRVVPVFTLLGHPAALLLISRPDQLSVMPLRMLALSASLVAVLAFYVMATLTEPPPNISINSCYGTTTLHDEIMNSPNSVCHLAKQAFEMLLPSSTCFRRRATIQL
jgi:hypothetical protein